MSLPADWKCPDTLAEITTSARVQGALRVFIVIAALGLLLGVVLAWW